MWCLVFAVLISKVTSRVNERIPNADWTNPNSGSNSSSLRRSMRDVTCSCFENKTASPGVASPGVAVRNKRPGFTQRVAPARSRKFLTPSKWTKTSLARLPVDDDATAPRTTRVEVWRFRVSDCRIPPAKTGGNAASVDIARARETLRRHVPVEMLLSRRQKVQCNKIHDVLLKNSAPPPSPVRPTRSTPACARFRPALFLPSRRRSERTIPSSPTRIPPKPGRASPSTAEPRLCPPPKLARFRFRFLL